MRRLVRTSLASKYKCAGERHKLHLQHSRCNTNRTMRVPHTNPARCEQDGCCNYFLCGVGPPRGLRPAALPASPPTASHPNLCPAARPLHYFYVCADVEFGRIQARDLLQHLLTGPISNAPVDIVRVRNRGGPCCR